MLRYLNKGLRDYNTLDRNTPHVRSNWEFMIVAKGGLRIVDDHDSSDYLSDTLWLLPPHSKHFWQNPPKNSCFVYCFHFASVHPMIENYLSQVNSLSINLSKSDLKKIKTIYDSLISDYNHPQPWSSLVFEKAMLDLSLLIAAHPSIKQNSSMGCNVYEIKVQQAMQWHHHHPAESLNVKKIAKAIHVSPSHLRRMFLKVTGDTPKKAFIDATMNNACKLMSESTLSLKEIAFQCGFQGFSQFYRSFKQHHKISPSEWRDSRHYGKYGFKSQKKL